MYLINSFFVFRYLVKVTKNKKTSCPVCLLFTEKVNFLLSNKEKKISVKTGFEELKKIKINRTADFFVFGHFDQITKNKLMRYIQN